MPAVTAQQVFDYINDSAGNAMGGLKIVATLQYSAATNINPLAGIAPNPQTTTTDGNGYFAFNLVPNGALNPANTTYLIETPFRSYQITVGPAGPYQTIAVGTIVNVPATLAPATSNVTGPLTVAGLLTANGGLTVVGVLVLPAAAIADAALSANVDLLNAAQAFTGAKTFSTNPVFNVNAIPDAAVAALAASKLTGSALPAGITGSSLTSVGVLAAPHMTSPVVDSGPMTISAAASQIVPGATSVSLRNNANGADNLLVTDAGFASLRNALSIPPSAGGTVASTNYGSVPILIDVQTPSGVNSFDFVNPLPTGFRNLYVKYQARETGAVSTDLIVFRFNNDSAGNYYYNRVAISGVGAWSNAVETLGNGAGAFGFVVGSSIADAAQAGSGEAWLDNYTGTTFYKQWRGSTGVDLGVATTNIQFANIWGFWKNTAAITRITVLAGTGNFVAGSTFELWGEP